MNVYGWDRDLETGGFDTEKSIKPINIYTGKRIISAKETSKAVFEGNLDASEKVITEIVEPGTSPATNFASPISVSGNNMDFLRKVEKSEAEVFNVPYTVYDKLGNDYTITLTFVKNEIGTDSVTGKPITQWFWYALPDDTRQGILNHEYNQEKGLNPTDPGAKVPDIDPATITPAQGIITFDEAGKPIDVEPDSVLLPDNKLSTDITVTPNAGTDAFDITLDFSNLTQFKADGSVKATDVNGYGPGKLVTFNIGTDGIITGIYSNGQQQALGMIALAFFENPAGLQKVGSNLYIPTTNSGDFKKGLKPGSEGVGTLSPGTLEMSNVDLSREFTEMITTQRGFQANSRIITTSDEMLQELVNLKR
jgi:flagellar hook protein FlgE